ncbi:MAG: bifunctional tRNA (5-methylaminomethyl-2-thiouridine)(34)-methyltransferase MnmD/FAD-dependent 5-carboxymethylaminomethyl-2-thiouridine(34) oxidoreductase MnmC [Porticoccaceae bacterium]
MGVLTITPADLEWDDQGQPRSRAFNDLYFSAENGLEETRYVFLKGNQLEQRWQNLADGEQFVIAETGFGSGLNLLAAAELWLATAPKTAQLHFISTELYPMRREDLQRTLACWPELADLAAQLVDNYPALTPGFHRFELADNIRVTLIFEDVITALGELCPTLATEMWDYQNWGVDAWFLDGFAPSQNPEMWADQLFPLINRLSTDRATAATFTSAGVVKRGLSNWGFEIEKIPGYGRKREMLVARRNPELDIDLSSRKEPHRNASACWHLDAEQQGKPGSVAIIGAGIAGCTLSEALSRRGIQCSLFDAGDIGSGASGNPQAALYARLSPGAALSGSQACSTSGSASSPSTSMGGDLEDFCLHALEYAAGYYSRRIDRPELGDLCGLVQLARDDREAEKMARIGERFANAKEFCKSIDVDEAGKLTGLNIASSGLFFSQSGWINGPAFCRQLLQTSGATLIPNTPITRIARFGDRFRLCSADSDQGEFDAVVLCTAMGSLEFADTEWLPLRPIRGQISFLQNQPETSPLKTVLCRETYLTPSYQGLQSVGATYDLDTDSSEVKPGDHQTNLAELQSLLGLDEPVRAEANTLKGRAATRTTTPDYLPLVGNLPSLNRFLDQYEIWRKDRKRAIPEAHKGHKGMYLNLGYGSRGFTYAPICAELLAAQIAQEPEPLPGALRKALHPARFLVRALARNRSIDSPREKTDAERQT